MDNSHLSHNDNNNSSAEMKEFNIRSKITSSLNRLKFLKECIAEQVLPKSAPAALKNSERPFSDAARAYLEEACNEIKDNIYVLNEERMGLTTTSTEPRSETETTQ